MLKSEKSIWNNWLDQIEYSKPIPWKYWCNIKWVSYRYDMDMRQVSWFHGLDILSTSYHLDSCFRKISRISCLISISAPEVGVDKLQTPLTINCHSKIINWVINGIQGSPKFGFDSNFGWGSYRTFCNLYQQNASWIQDVSKWWSSSHVLPLNFLKYLPAAQYVQMGIQPVAESHTCCLGCLCI